MSSCKTESKSLNLLEGAEATGVLNVQEADQRAEALKNRVSQSGDLQTGLGGRLSATSLICKCREEDEALKARLSYNASLENKGLKKGC